MTLPALVLLSFSLSVAAQAADNRIDPFIQEKEQGWFWYKKEPELREEKTPLPRKPEVKPEVQSIQIAPEEKPIKEPEHFSVEWFQQKYLGVLSNAVDNPTPENVREYRYATRVMLDKASNFAHEFKRQSLLDPLLDESNRYPFASTPRGSFQRFTNEQKKAAINSIKEKVGFWVFVDEGCHFCVLQYPIIERTFKQNNMTVQYITKDGKRPSWMKEDAEVLPDLGQSSHLKIKVRPATAMIVPPKKIVVLTQGMLSSDLLEERMLTAAYVENLLDKQTRMLAFPMEKGLLTPDDIKAAGQAMKDGGKMSSKVQEMLQQRGNE